MSSPIEVLVTAFQAFGGMSVNPTQQLLATLDQRGVEDAEVTTLLLPVNYDECVERVVAEIDRLQPDVVLSCGLYAGRSAVTPERIGINVKDTMAEDPIPDNSGRSPVDEPVRGDGPDALFATLPVREITQRLLAAGIPAFVSNTAGTYICNNTLYGVLDHLRRRQLPTLAGFLHFPASTEMAMRHPTMPSLPLEMSERALRVALETCVEAARRRREPALRATSSW